MPQLAHHRAGIVFIVAFIGITLFQLLAPASLRLNSSDYREYYVVVAQNLLEGRGFVLADDRPAIANPPLYPLMVAGLIGLARLGIPETFLFNAFNAACLALSVVVVYWLGRRLWGERGGLLAAVLWLTYPFMLLLSTERLTEPPFIAALYLGLAAFWQSLRKQSLSGFALAAVLLGAAMLIRSIAIAILPVCALILWLTTQPLRLKVLASTMLLSVGALVALPWTIAIYAQTGQLVLLGTNSIPSIRDGLTFAVGKDYRQVIGLDAEVIALMERLFSRRDQMTSLGTVVAVVGEEFSRTPDVMFRLFALKAVRSWFATDSGRLETLSLLIQIPYLIAIGLSSLRAFCLVPAQRTYVLGTWLIVIYIWLMTFLVLSILRYMTPVMGLLMTIVPSLLISLSAMQQAELA